jgi:hypothetical protein
MKKTARIPGQDSRRSPEQVICLREAARGQGQVTEGDQALQTAWIQRNRISERPLSLSGQAQREKTSTRCPASVRPNETEGFGGDESESDGIEFADFDDEDDIPAPRSAAKSSSAPAAAAAPKVPMTATGEIDLDAI